jgi:hypothetical protein
MFRIARENVNLVLKDIDRGGRDPRFGDNTFARGTRRFPPVVPHGPMGAHEGHLTGTARLGRQDVGIEEQHVLQPRVEKQVVCQLDSLAGDVRGPNPHANLAIEERVVRDQHVGRLGRFLKLQPAHLSSRHDIARQMDLADLPVQ